ncbi:OLC1v1032767C1 [Oldenlandia corymbosa var. corymbosa]|uniref:OLC1v1032767C1 n=1 Tax=Oldenlandia corymbosa var. corymbosa TaxID=529605 RepID=A0AAV1CNK9_OLDCO|nr:OLC1v1032767C1 [Oldenlandia corymbosa var. corymbosa]
MDADHSDCKPKSKLNQASGRDETSSSSSSGRDHLENDEFPSCSKEKNGSAVDNNQVIDAVDVRLEEEHPGAAGIEKLCRICHLNNEQSSSRSPELIQLGCNCKEELGLSHRHCAEAWFKHKGNRVCEICNKIAKNVRFAKEPRVFVVEINQLRSMAYANTSSYESSPATDISPIPRQGDSRLCKQSCNFLLGCLALALIISTFVRVKLF